MKELNAVEVDAVSGGFWLALFENLMASAAYEILSGGVKYAMKNSYMGRGQFPSVQRAGHE